MSDTNATNDHVWPSQNDIAPTVGEGKTWLEVYHKALNIGLMVDNYVLSGGTLPASDTDLTALIAAGSAIIDGRYVAWDQTTITLPNASTSHIFVKLSKASSLASNVVLEDNTTGTQPADSVKLGTITTAGGVITTSTDQRLLKRNYKLPRLVRFTANGTWRCPEGITEVIVMCRGGGGGGGGGGTDGVSGGCAGMAGQAGLAGASFTTQVTVVPGTSYTVTIGSGGAGGAGGGAAGVNFGTNGSNGSDGGTTTFGVLASASGGDGGAGGLGGASSGAPQSSAGKTVNGVANTGRPGTGGEGGNGSGAPTDGSAGGTGGSGLVEIYY